MTDHDDAVLVLVDIQQDYFEGGAWPLPGSPSAVAAARRLLEHWRGGGRTVVHVTHRWEGPDAEAFRPGTPGIEVHPDVAPRDGEPVLVKTEPSAFVGTDLDVLSGGAHVVVAGNMSNLCVDSTARAALDRGLTVTVVHDACAAAPVEFDGLPVPPESVHAAFMGGLRDAGATVVASREVVGED